MYAPNLIRAFGVSEDKEIFRGPKMGWLKEFPDAQVLNLRSTSRYGF